MRSWSAITTVYRKEIVDALRDRRPLLMVLISVVALALPTSHAVPAVLAQPRPSAHPPQLYLADPSRSPDPYRDLDRHDMASLRLGRGVVLLAELQDGEAGLTQGRPDRRSEGRDAGRELRAAERREVHLRGPVFRLF